ncbi:cell division protein ZipA [Maribrevibacterium harenarium]|uniref:Cell division protein ZipA n=1 Tax=Maribrevibacterium harenarium TaxID=2589817 RepID=A0A501X2L9_9GAMM|nr:cell division protein ZipA [Maribrevibacterium harenarium]TPE54736.1 cell division protein ZipA [Maribrevibacterium harenarium]
MDFSLREWLILIGLIIIAVILIDGVRRYRKAQQLTTYPDDDDWIDPDEALKEAMVKRELPNGGARPVSEDVNDPIMNAFENARKTVKGPLTDLPHKVDAGPALDRNDQFELEELATLVPERLIDESPERLKEQDYADVPDDDYSDYMDDQALHEPQAPSEVGESNYEQDYGTVDLDQTEAFSSSAKIDESVDDEDNAEIEEVIVINVFAEEGNPYAGMELLQLVLNCGMRYGEMDIFHRHEEGYDKGKVQFSMANAIEPGTFDLETMGESQSPGVSFFMGLPGPKNSMRAFDFMLETAQVLTRNLGGELRDERRSPMSEQTIAHCRQRIRDFERRRMARSKRS